MNQTASLELILEKDVCFCPPSTLSGIGTHQLTVWWTGISKQVTIRLSGSFLTRESTSLVMKNKTSSSIRYRSSFVRRVQHRLGRSGLNNTEKLVLRVSVTLESGRLVVTAAVVTTLHFLVLSFTGKYVLEDGHELKLRIIYFHFKFLFNQIIRFYFSKSWSVRRYIKRIKDKG